MNVKNGKRGSIELFLTREFFNSLVTVLSAFITADETNKYAGYALRLKEKIMKHGRKFSHKNTEQIVIYFYAEEAAILIKLLVIYANATGISGEDFFALAGKK